MTAEILGHPIRKIGIIGSGQIGPDIALHFAKVFHRDRLPVVVVDVSKEALEKGQKKLHKKVDRGIKSGAFSADMGQAMKESCLFTDSYEELRGVDLVIEAATEDAGLKGRIFQQVAGLASEGAFLASNSSHLEPEVIFADFADRSRTMVIHYFFPAERNPVVEVVPGADTDPQVAAAMLSFYESIGKVPIGVKSRYGYAIDPIFEGIFEAAALLVEEGAGTTREVDAVACRALGLTVGPFTAMNLTGGNPITQHGLGIMHEKVMPWFRSPGILDEAMKSGEPWETPKRGETVDVDPEREKRIQDAMRGAYFGLAGEILDSGIVGLADLEMAVEIALDLTPPLRLMNDLGVGASLELVERYAAAHDGFKVPECVREQAAKRKPWRVPVVLREDRGDVAVVTIRRPKVLNALSEQAFEQLEEHFEAIKNDPAIAGAVLTGFGVKAFVSGADVNFLARIDSPEMGERTSLASLRSLAVIENLGKPVVCALNGYAFGGGNELAMACTARIARKGLKVLAGQPEPNLGIIPGAGATQRLPRLVGIERAAELLRTGRSVSSAEALRIGLISREIEGDLVGEAVSMARAAASGESPLPAIQRGPLQVGEKLPQVDLGHLSKAVDAILCRAILEGCRLPLEEGLALEAKMFGEVCKTRDMRIGIENFIKNGPRARAEFVHE
ncbi:MAG: 3-hydroxyacyl-CoA dehydrogenase/enoyl-CoA hydratase family protein [Planctomycetota bacterium]